MTAVFAVDALAGKCCVVTGAASGSGRAIAIALAEVGAEVFAVDVQEGPLEETAALALKPLAGTYVADLAETGACANVIERACRTLSRLTTLVNCAGVPRAGSGNESVDDWHRVLGVNLTAAWVLSREAVPHMRAAGGGSIVNVSSIIAGRSYRGRGDSFAYPASKAGLLGLTQSMAILLGKDGIRVNAILPGLIRTPMGKRFVAAAERLNEAGTGIPIGRVGEPEDVAALSVFLASDVAGYITGTAIPLDGGMSVEVGWDRFLQEV